MVIGGMRAEVYDGVDSPIAVGLADCNRMTLQIEALFEAHLPVRDLDRSVAFYRDVLGLSLASYFAERHVAFFWVGAPGRTMLGLWQSGFGPLSLKLHVAFRVDLPMLLAAPRLLSQAGITVRNFGGDETQEPSVLAWMPAAVLYFPDPDGHSLELLTMLPEEGRPEWGVLPLHDWNRRIEKSAA